MNGFDDQVRTGPESQLNWGRHFLMCSPDYFDVSYSINCWMDPSVRVDLDRAGEQWAGLGRTLRSAGAAVAEIAPQPGLPDMVFTANAGIVDGTTYWPASMRHPERQPEIAHLRRCFSANDWTVAEPPGAVQEGAGDALPFAGTLVAGHGQRSTAEAYQELADRAGWTITPVQLADPRFYHVDLAFCPLDQTTALIAPVAFTSDACERLARLVPDPIAVTADEAAMFCANSVVVGRTIIMPGCTARLGRQLERRGFDVAVCDVSEFVKAGGGCRCLTLALDVSLAANSGSIDEAAA